MFGARLPPGIPVVLNEHNIEYEVLERMSTGERSTLRRAYNRLEFGTPSPLRATGVAPRRRLRDHFRTRSRRHSIGRAAHADLGRAERCRHRLLLPVTGAHPSPTRSSSPASCRTDRTSTRSTISSATSSRLIRRRRPECTLTIVGGGVGDLIELSGPGVHFTDYVDDLRPYIARASVAVAPIRMGSGTRLKVVEALAMAKPMVSTTIGCEGIDVRDGEHLLIADSPAAFADRVVQLLEHPDDARHLGERGAALARRGVLVDPCGRCARGPAPPPRQHAAGRFVMSSVSVIIPCYNYASFLPACLESVLSQGVDVAVLIIDDCSTDDTPTVGAALAADPRVTFRRHEQNIRHIATYNEGLDWANGDFTVLLSADDLLTPGALAARGRGHGRAPVGRHGLRPRPLVRIARRSARGARWRGPTARVPRRRLDRAALPEGKLDDCIAGGGGAHVVLQGARRLPIRPPPHRRPRDVAAHCRPPRHRVRARRRPGVLPGAPPEHVPHELRLTSRRHPRTQGVLRRTLRSPGRFRPRRAKPAPAHRSSARTRSAVGGLSRLRSRGRVRVGGRARGVRAQRRTPEPRASPRA